MKNNQDKRPTWTTRIMDLLAGKNDFMSTQQIREAVGANCNQASASLIHLRRRHAVDCVIEPNGVAWWLATPEDDVRCRHCDERVEEEKGSRKPRKATSAVKQVFTDAVTGETQTLCYYLKPKVT